jgi:hypothetical protein
MATMLAVLMKLTPRIRSLLKTLIVAYPVKFPAIYGTAKFSTLFISPPLVAILSQSTPSHRISQGPIAVLFSYLRLRHPSDIFLSEC